MTQWFNAYVQTQPRRASIIFGLAGGRLLFAAAMIATRDVFWSVLSGISGAVCTGLVLYSLGTWDRGW